MSEWKKINMKGNIDILTGYAFSSSNFNDEEGIPLIRIRDLETHNPKTLYKGNYDDKYIINKGDILIGMDGEFNTVRWKGPKSLLNQRVAKIKSLNPHIINNEFIFYRLQIELKKIESLTPATTVKHLSKKDIENLTLILPPEQEQRKIAAILSSVDEAIEKTEAIIEQTEKVKKGLMQQLLTKGIGHTKFKKTEIGEIPEKWEVKKIGEIASVEYGISESVSSNTDPSIGIPILTGANITLDGTLDLSKLVYIEKKQQERFQLKKGDLLFNWRSGSQHHVGKTAIFNLDGDYTYASFILRIRLNEDSHNEFYYYLLNYLKSIDYFIKNTSMQVNFKLNASSFKELLVVKPTLEEQIRISKIISSVDKKIQKEKNRLNQLQTIKQGLMQVLLTGKVRVKVNEDEVVSS
ncbi:MAG: restriction endonuclease subunit S [Exiguobacterium sp.]|nr:restriction endonuclease subunit S [Exiguobacterium sp.]